MCEAESTVFYMLHNMYYRLGTLVAILRRCVSSKVESIVHPSCVCTYGSYDHCFVHAAYVYITVLYMLHMYHCFVHAAYVCMYIQWLFYQFTFYLLMLFFPTSYATRTDRLQPPSR
jgi:hypothetical protein